MKNRSENIGSRRELFVSVCRYTAAALLTTGAVGIFAKRRRLVREGKCTGSGLCEGCEILASCELPRALSARELLIGGANGGK